MDTKSCFSIDASDLSDDARCKLPAQGQQPAPLAAIAMRMDVTTDLGCHPFECGTSVYAAGRAALALAQTQLAEAGIAQSELEQLRTANVSVMQAVVPFIFQFEKIPAPSSRPRTPR